MTILEVHNLKKVYTTRFGGNQVQALRNIQFSVEEGEYGRVRIGQDNTFEYSGGA